ncbi:MAG: 16S rRNA (adenine(1518)-N(6)/adenine(1519)-N(6))-dimethyltransferase RsmA [Treponema sp.]|nr:16S rRNA (adenine(1518)-N(6)/adenine(1519)-N(6))-dimethyltransferase RsmA [Treponema sp.]
MLPLPNFDSPRELRKFLDERGLGMRKKFGQNFLINPAIRGRLVEALDIPQGEAVWEIGPGLGAMTALLLERGAQVRAFEIDPAFGKLLMEFFPPQSLTSGSSFTLVEGDVLKTWPRIWKEGDQAPYLLGNLPYTIAAALLADMIEKGRRFTRLVVTLQREVAQRMAAGPGSRDYSSFSVLCASVYKISPLMVIKGPSFYPAPHVDSQALRLDLLEKPLELPRLFYPLVRSLFSSRRKNLRNTLSGFAASVILKPGPAPSGPEGKAPRGNQGLEAAAAILARAGIAPERRAETLGIAEFAALASYTEEVCGYGR